VVVETPVLDRDGRLRHPGADLIETNRLPVAFRRNRPQQRSVSSENERVLPDLNRVERIEAAAVHPDRRAGEARDDQKKDSADEGTGHEPAESLPAVLHPLPTPLPQAVKQEGV